MSANTQSASREANESSGASNMHFLDAWRQAVLLIGERLFSCQARNPETATHAHQLTPNLILIRKAFANKSRQDAVFIAAVVSLYNSAEGQKLLKKAECNFGDMALVLKPQQRVILANLFLHYQGW